MEAKLIQLGFTKATYRDRIEYTHTNGIEVIQSEFGWVVRSYDGLCPHPSCLITEVSLLGWILVQQDRQDQALKEIQSAIDKAFTPQPSVLSAF